MDNKLTVTIEDGSKVTIDVIDMIESNVYGKTFVIYNISGDRDNIFASILNEKETTFSLDTITKEEEINFVKNEIERIISEDEESNL